MKQILSRLAAASGLALAGASAALAQVNPTASSVNEEALMRGLQSGEVVGGRVSIPNPEAAALINPDNKLWAAMQGATLHTLSIAAILVTLAVLGLFYLIRGRSRVEGGFSGR